MNDEYIFREPPKKPLNLIYCGFMNNYYSKQDKKDTIDLIRKKYKNDTIWVMTTKKGFNPLRSDQQ